MTMDWTEGWHFYPADVQLGCKESQPIMVGETITIDGPLKPWSWGLSASREAWEALDYAPYRPYLCRVRLGGEIIYDHNKAVATERTCLAMLSERETAVLLRRWAIWCVRRVEHLLTDPRSRRVLDVAEAWCNGTATDKDLAAAGDHAGDAAGNGDRNTRSAAWAARATAFTVEDAARTAARSAWFAAHDTARNPARAGWAATNAQYQMLEIMCIEAISASLTRGG